MDLIAAADRNWAIGKDGGLLCHLPEDLKYFKKMYTYCFVLFSWLVLEMDPSCRQYSRYNYLKVFLEN